MNELVKMLVLIIAGICLGAVGYRWHSRMSRPVDTRPVKHVAIVTKNVQLHREVTDATVAELARETRVRIVPHIYFSDAKNKMSEGVVINQAIEDKPDLILALGNALAQSAKGLIEKRARGIPLVFGAVTDPVGLGLVETLEKPGCNVSGAACMPVDNTLCIRFLKKACPSVKRILFPYYIESGEAVENVAKEIAAFAAEVGVEVILLPLDSEQNSVVFIQTMLPSIDVIMYLQYCVTNRISDNIAKLAKQYGVIFYSPNKKSVMRGEAPLGFGVDLEKSGADAAKIVCKILVDGVAADQIPVCFDKYNQRLFINREAAAEQGASIDEDLLLLLAQVEFISQNVEQGHASKNSI